MLQRPRACIDFVIAVLSVTLQRGGGALELVFRGTPAGNVLVMTRCWRFIRLVKAGVKLGKGAKARAIFDDNGARRGGSPPLLPEGRSEEFGRSEKSESPPPDDSLPPAGGA
eukprot:gene49419-64623_t